MNETFLDTDDGLCPERLRRISAFLEAKISSGTLPGAVTLIHRHGKIVYRDIRGWQDMEKGLPMAEDSIFRIYSLTKIVTTVALLMLYEEGSFDLNDPVSTLIPAFGKQVLRLPDGGMEDVPRPTTVYDLLRHCGGLAPMHDVEALLASDHDLESFCTELAGHPLAVQPNTRWLYGTSTDVVARIVEVVSGQRFDAFLQERIFRPLGMVDTGFRLRDGQESRFTVCYHHRKEGGLSVQDPADASSLFCKTSPFLSGSAGLLSTPRDYMNFCVMLLNRGAYPGGYLLSRKTVELMCADHLPVGHPNLEIGYQSFRFGLGVSVMTEPHRSRSLACKGDFGWGGAAGTQVWISPEEDMVVMIMIQVRSDVPTGIMDGVKRLAYQALV